MITEEDIERAIRSMVQKAKADLDTQILEKGLSTLTLKLNYNPYNMGYKIEKTYKYGYDEKSSIQNKSNN